MTLNKHDDTLLALVPDVPDVTEGIPLKILHRQYFRTNVVHARECHAHELCWYELETSAERKRSRPPLEISGRKILEGLD